MSNLLYIFDDSARPPARWSQDCRLVLCPLTTDFELIDKVADAARAAGVSRIEVENYAEVFNRKAFAVRDDYVEFIAGFADKPIIGGRSFKEVLTDKRLGGSLWWLSTVSEKNTVASKSFDRLVSVLAIVDIADRRGCQEMRLDIDDEKLVATLRDNAKVIGVNLVETRAFSETRPDILWYRSLAKAALQLAKLSAKMVTARWAMRGSRATDALKQARYLIVAYFPFFDPEAWAKGRFSSRYFGPLQAQLERKYPGRVAYLAMFNKVAGGSWRRGLKLGRQASDWGYSFSFVEQWAGPRDILSTAWTALGAAVKFARARRQLAAAFVFKTGRLSLSAWPLFEDDFYNSFSGQALILGIYYRRVFKKVRRLIAPGTVIVYAAENLTWEKALNMAAKERPDTKVVGIQHTTVPRLVLTYAVGKTEMDGSGDGMPAPDYLACAGDVTAQFLGESGWSRRRVFPWAAVRYDYFPDLLEGYFPWEERPKVVVVALSYQRQESLETLCFAWQALAHTGTKVIVKAHPVASAESLVAQAGLDLEAGGFEISFSPLRDLLPRARAVIVRGSSAGLEGLASGCQVIIPLLVSGSDRNCLSTFCDLQTYAATPGELRARVAALMDADEAPASLTDCREFVRRYLRMPKRNDEWLTTFEEGIGEC